MMGGNMRGSLEMMRLMARASKPSPPDNATQAPSQKTNEMAEES
jgi:hypothetical protein